MREGRKDFTDGDQNELLTSTFISRRESNIENEIMNDEGVWTATRERPLIFPRGLVGLKP